MRSILIRLIRPRCCEVKKYPGPQVFQLPKGLSKEKAFALAKKKAKRDFRGFSYDPETGVAKLI